jgi:hypothetical protein
MAFAVGASSIAQVLIAVLGFLYFLRLDWTESGEVIRSRANTDKQQAKDAASAGVNTDKQQTKDAASVGVVSRDAASAGIAGVVSLDTASAGVVSP